MLRRPLVAAFVAGLAAVLVAARWWAQGSGNVYTDVGKRFYVPDPALGWRLSPPGPIWLGLDAVGAVGVLSIAVAGAALWLRRRERQPGWLVAALWLVSAGALALPIAAFAGGGAPDDARERLPASIVAPPVDGVSGGLPGLPAGRYEVVAHPQTAVVAGVSAGGEEFGARFSEVDGSWQGDPTDLAQPMSASFSVAVASVDTGVAGRTDHARDGYLDAKAHPRIGFTLDRVLAAASGEAGAVAFRAAGRVSLMGRTHPVEVVGALRALAAADRARLAIAHEAVLLMDASFNLDIRETALAPDAGDFDQPVLAITAKLVLAPRR